MTRNKLLIPVALLVAVALSACDQQAEPAASASPDAAPTEAAPATATSATPATPVEESPAPAAAATLIWADPLLKCGGKQITKVYWSKEALAAGPVRIEIGEGASPGLFASVGAEGSKETGKWAAPGIVFVLRTAADGAERARVVLTGPANCP